MELNAHSQRPESWLVGDWLINYQGDFIRRGLLGEVFFQLANLTHLDLVWTVVVVQIFIYAVFFFFTCRLAINSRFSLSTALLICSPAFILFPVLSLPGSYRKEILLFALLAFMIWEFTRPRQQPAWFWPLVIGVASILMVMSHEMLVAYLPYLLCPFLIKDSEDWFQKARNVALSLIPATLTAAGLILFSRGTPEIVARICGSLGTRAPLNCTSEGAIYKLSDSAAFAFSQIQLLISQQMLLLYAGLALLSLVPLVLVYFTDLRSRIDFHGKRLLLLSGCILAAVVSSIPLFLVAVDYGRLIYIHIVCLSLLSLMLLQQSHKEEPISLNLKAWPGWILAFLFVISWRLPYLFATFSTAFPLIYQLIKLFH